MRKKTLDDDSRKRFINYSDNELCKYCGNYPAITNGYCSKKCTEKDEVWNWSSQVILMLVKCKNCGKDFELFVSEFCCLDCSKNYYLKPE